MTETEIHRGVIVCIGVYVGPMVTKEVDCLGVRADSGDSYKDNSK